MDEETIHDLNALNRDFYRAVADDFDTTRGRPWPGWRGLLPWLTAESGPLRVLDVGCGNGRFGAFLAASVRRPLFYTGVDNNPPLLERARTALEPLAQMNVQLLERDIVSELLPGGPFELIALFGVLHHVPAFARRRELLRALARRLAPGGVLAFACWRFLEYARFRERIVPWPGDLTAEPGDYLLDWRRGANAVRYCHHVDDSELAALIAATGLTPLTTYRADGQTGDANLYAVLRREA